MARYDLSIQMPAGETYTDRYGGYLDFFEQVDRDDWVDACPLSWATLLLYMGVNLSDKGQAHFPEDQWFPPVYEQQQDYARAWTAGNHRTLVEHRCSARPETVDALWKLDMQWDKFRDPLPPGNVPFTLASYSGFWRADVVRYMRALDVYQTKHKRAVITNCSADKPYPDEIHQRIKEAYPDHELLIATGVLGIVPELLWMDMPQYDCGLPNFWRLYQRALSFFARNRYRHVHVMTEFYQQAILPALYLVAGDTVITTEFPFGPYAGYALTRDHVFEQRDPTAYSDKFQRNPIIG